MENLGSILNLGRKEITVSIEGHTFTGQTLSIKDLQEIMAKVFSERNEAVQGMVYSFEFLIRCIKKIDGQPIEPEKLRSLLETLPAALVITLFDKFNTELGLNPNELEQLKKKLI